jgi:hypothetical protein
MLKLRATGINELIAANNKLMKRLEENKDFEHMLDKIVEKARNNCPVGLTGDLMKAIRWEKIGKGQYVIICDIPYARWIEYGTRYFPVGKVTSPRGYKSSSGKMASVPFLRSAIWDVSRQFPEMMDSVVNVIYN